MKLNNIAIYIMNRVAQVKHYDWGNDFNVEEMLSAYESSIEYLQDEKVDFLSMTKEELKEYGFKSLSESSNIMLIPIWAYDMIPDGTKLSGLGYGVKGKDYIDLDIRGGCLAYGIEVDSK